MELVGGFHYSDVIAGQDTRLTKMTKQKVNSILSKVLDPVMYWCAKGTSDHGNVA